MNGWLWLIAALVLAGVELIAPGWLFLGTAFGVAALGVLILTGLWPWGLGFALVAAALISGVAWLALRGIMGARAERPRIWDRDIND